MELGMNMGMSFDMELASYDYEIPVQCSECGGKVALEVKGAELTTINRCPKCNSKVTWDLF